MTSDGKPNAFEQTSSFLTRQSWIIGLVVAAFLLQFLGVYLGSTEFLKGLTTVSNYNRLYDLTTLATENVTSSAKTLEKLLARTGVDDLGRVFQVSYVEAKSNLEQAVALTGSDQETRETLAAAQAGLIQFHDAALDAIKRANLPRSRISDIKPKLLLAGQFQLEINESLRKLQITLRGKNTKVFESTYQARYIPVIVAVVLADRKSTRLNSSHSTLSRMPSSA